MTDDQLIGFAQRSADDAWLNSNTQTAEVFTAIVRALQDRQQAERHVKELQEELEARTAATRDEK